jgi:uncharacterized protein YyaL (SSP411 family)
VPNKVPVVVAETEVASLAVHVPMVRGKVTRKGETTAYVCQQGLCQLPTIDPGVFAEQTTGDESS